MPAYIQVISQGSWDAYPRNIQTAVILFAKDKTQEEQQFVWVSPCTIKCICIYIYIHILMAIVKEHNKTYPPETTIQ